MHLQRLHHIRRPLLSSTRCPTYPRSWIGWADVKFMPYDIARTKRQAYTAFILRLLLAGTTLYVAGLFNTRSSLKLARAFRKFSARELARLRRALRQLEQRRLIRLVDSGEETIVTLTLKGNKEVERMRLAELTIPELKEWDKKWRMVLFDIPEYLRLGRDVLRHTLKRLGFYQIQKSVFVCPYPCDREITAIVKTFKFERYIHCFTIDTVKTSYHKHLMLHFGLTSKI